MQEYKHVIGIDLGTTNTLACYLKGGKPEIVKFPGGKMLPSVLYVDKDGKILVGTMAKKKGAGAPKAMVRSAKTWIGDYEAKKTWNLRGKVFNPTDVATEVLKEVRKNVVKSLKCDEDEEIGAVITVPAYFNSNQTDETRKAGEAAGFKILQIVTEPMAAAVAAVRGMDIENKKVLVVDLGGGTFDLSVLKADSENQTYQAIDIAGDSRLGGDDVDQMLIAWLLNVIKDDTGVDLESQEASGMDEETYYSKLTEINDAVEKAKKELSESDEADIVITHLLPDYDVDITLDRSEFEEICAPFFAKVKSKLDEFLNRNPNFNKDDLGETILAGGSCYIPRVQQDVESFNVPYPNATLDRSTLVVTGAAHIAEFNNGALNVKIEDILSHSLGLQILKNKQDVFSAILKKGEKYPCTHTESFTTVYDDQDQIDLRIYEAGSDAENEEGIENHKFYGSMVLDGIELAPQGVPDIEVTFAYDRSRCLVVTAKDKKTGAAQSLKLMKGQEHKKPEAPIDFMLLLDISGSMEGDSLKSAIAASKSLFNDIIDFSVHRAGLIAFDHEAQVLSSPTTDKDFLANKVSYLHARGGTDMGNALAKARTEMTDSKRKKIIILVTDGEDLSEEASLATGKRMKDAGFRIITIGAGKDIDADFLKKLASPNDFYTIKSMKDLKNAFEEVIAGLTKK